jgi:hypothetical protein
MKRSTIASLAPWGVTLALLVFVALRPAQAVQRADYSSLSSADLLMADEIRHSPQDVQVIGDRLVIRLREDAPLGGYYEWQVVYRAVTTFQQDGQSGRELTAAADADADVEPNWREQLPARQRWEAHRNQARGISQELREQLRALPEAE